MKVVACYYDTHIFFWLNKKNHNPETEPLCIYIAVFGFNQHIYYVWEDGGSYGCLAIFF